MTGLEFLSLSAKEMAEVVENDIDLTRISWHYKKSRKVMKFPVSIKFLALSDDKGLYSIKLWGNTKVDIYTSHPIHRSNNDIEVLQVLKYSHLPGHIEDRYDRP